MAILRRPNALIHRVPVDEFTISNNRCGGLRCNQLLGCDMSKWIFEKPDETEPGEHAYALVVYTGDSKEVGVRCLERAAIRNGFGVHVFAWQPMQYPNLGIDDVGKVVDQYNWSARGGT
jgi:hypothetical protein